MHRNVGITVYGQRGWSYRRRVNAPYWLFSRTIGYCQKKKNIRFWNRTKTYGLPCMPSLSPHPVRALTWTYTTVFIHLIKRTHVVQRTRATGLNTVRLFPRRLSPACVLIMRAASAVSIPITAAAAVWTRQTNPPNKYNHTRVVYTLSLHRRSFSSIRLTYTPNFLVEIYNLHVPAAENEIILYYLLPAIK